MRRGLIAHSKVELPDAVFDARLERLRAAMAGLDALLVYTNNTRPAGVSWLVGFIPYWSEAILVLPRIGPPVLVVALTFRVKPWIERTSRVGEVVFTPGIGIETARLIAAKKADAIVGVVDFDSSRPGIADDLREAGPRLAFPPTPARCSQRCAPSPTPPIMLTARAPRRIAARALSRIEARAPGIGAIVAAVEARARRGSAPKGLRGGRARPRPRPAAHAHRRRRRGRACARGAFCGARQRRLQGQLGAPRGDDRPRPHGGPHRGGCGRIRRGGSSPAETATCRNSRHSWWKDAGWRSRSRH
jgi:hypothetical protein